MKELKKALSEELKKYHNNVYYELADRKTTFPYIVFKIDDSNRMDYKEIVFATISIYDRDNTKIDIIEDLEQLIKKKFHNLDLKTENSISVLTHISSNNFDFLQEGYRRRELRFQIFFYNSEIVEN